MTQQNVNDPSKTIFVGNIPFNYDPDSLYDTLQIVGKIEKFRIKEENSDNEKTKGYGFCEYKDTETALSALKNLKNIDYNGRQLRINFADNDKTGLNLSQLSEDYIRSFKDFSYIKDNNSELNMRDTIKNLSDEQKLILINFLKCMAETNPHDFKNLLSNQTEEMLEIILELQQEMSNNSLNHTNLK